MLNENIRKLRKEKGYSQETLAQELNVVRQTVSKWEKGYSVPDAVMLEKIAEIFDISVSELLGTVENNKAEVSNLKRIADQLAVLNNQIARELTRKRRTRKVALIVFLSLLFTFIISFTISMGYFSSADSYTIENGLYETENTEMPYLLVYDEEKFTAVQDIAVSYQPSGDIYINGKEVIMKSTYAGEAYVWVFTLIGDNTLKLEFNKSIIPDNHAGWSDGMIFVLAEE